MARPKGPAPKKLDPMDIIRYARTGASQREIAAKVGMSLATFERRLQQKKYREALDAGRGELFISLRAKQVEVALSGNVQMLIWLGENVLDQARNHRIVDKEGKDRTVVDVTSPIEVINARIASVIARRGTSGGAEGS